MKCSVLHLIKNSADCNISNVKTKKDLTVCPILELAVKSLLI